MFWIPNPSFVSTVHQYDSITIVIHQLNPSYSVLYQSHIIPEHQMQQTESLILLDSLSINIFYLLT